jgi:hypothetical protein
MGEIEHFVDPLDKSHPRMAGVAGEVLTLFTAEGQVRRMCRVLFILSSAFLFTFSISFPCLW